MRQRGPGHEHNADGGVQSGEPPGADGVAGDGAIADRSDQRFQPQFSKIEPRPVGRIEKLLLRTLRDSQKNWEKNGWVRGMGRWNVPVGEKR